MLGAQAAKVRACCTISSNSLVVTSTLTGRGWIKAAISLARRSISNPPSLSMMLGLVVTPSRSPSSNQRRISSMLALSRKISISPSFPILRFLYALLESQTDQVVQGYVPGLHQRRPQGLLPYGDDEADIGGLGQIAAVEAG